MSEPYNESMQRPTTYSKKTDLDRRPGAVRDRVLDAYVGSTSLDWNQAREVRESRSRVDAPHGDIRRPRGPLLQGALDWFIFQGLVNIAEAMLVWAH